MSADKRLEMTPLHPRYGVQIHGVQLADLDDALFLELRAAFEQHSVLLLRDQRIDDTAHMALANRFGPIEDRLADERPQGEAFEGTEVSNIRVDGSLTEEADLHTLHLKSNMLWHADSTFMPTPALTNILIGRIVTDQGGETELSSTRAGWADMPEDLRQQIRGKGFWHHYAHSRAQISPELAKLPMFHKWPAQLWKSVWKNPVNGAEALYIASHTFAIEGMDASTSATLLGRAMSFVTQPEYVYAHKWCAGDVLIWDQRAVLHRATPWDYGVPRKLSSICVSATVQDGLDAMRPSV